MKFPPTLLCDFYKISHREQYPAGTERIYSTWTPRTSRLEGVTEVVNFGLQGFIQEWLVDFFQEQFFNRPLADIISEYSRVIKFTLGVQNPPTEHIKYLHGLGYLPLLIKALPEGAKVPLRVPTMTVESTDSKCFWLTNYIETLASCQLWKPTTSATLANEYRKLLEKWACETNGSAAGVEFQGHDFSMRGMDGVESAARSGAGHLLSFVGTDTIPAIPYLERYYGANIEQELVGTSIPATEHSVQCCYSDDIAYFKRIINEVYPSGLVSIVSDGRDFWDVIGNILPGLKADIMARTGGPVGDKVVIRPDSGDPVLICCGDPNGKTELERKGAIEALWDIFGGTVNAGGYKVLDSHIGLIYGDAITLARCNEICSRLAEKGFASINMVYGIGSYTYQYNTRDTLGFALKSTDCTIDGVDVPIFKDPKTDNGVKKSLKGKVVVLLENGKYVAYDQQTQPHDNDQLKPVFCNGLVTRQQTLAEIRARVRA